MNQEELKDKLKELQKEYEKNKTKIYIEFAKANNPYKIGDIISDHYQSIKIEKITFSVSFGIPECVYDGPLLKKDLSPRKDGKNGIIYQRNIKDNK